ncbi:hypothetical protein FRC14_000635 [Serendipita sp. 396]|nr:hypothetical protein FRC14_000635 [Serendipita sp. 396]KAG8828745.1 hypothetical protein FRC19_000133 [Serendipita sp. 401]
MNSGTDNASSPPFDTASQNGQQNSYNQRIQQVQQHDARFIYPHPLPINTSPQSWNIALLSSTQSPPYPNNMSSMNNDAYNMNNLMYQHARSSSFSTHPSLSTLPPSAPYSAGTVNPQLISSPPVPMDSSVWNSHQSSSQRSYYHQQHQQASSQGPQSPTMSFLNDAGLPPADGNGSIQALDGYFPLTSSTRSRGIDVLNSGNDGTKPLTSGGGSRSQSQSHSQSQPQPRSTRPSKSRNTSISGDNPHEHSLTSGSFISVPQSVPKSDSSGVFVAGPVRPRAQRQSSTNNATAPPPQQRTQRTRQAKKRKRVEEQVLLSDFDSDESDEDGHERKPSVVKYHKACSNCRKQKGRCEKIDASGRCSACRSRNLTCQFEPRKERQPPPQRSFLMEEIRRRDATIATLKQLIRPDLFAGFQYPHPRGNSSGSPPSSAAHEEPLRKQVLEWLDRLASEAHHETSFGLDSRAFQRQEEDSSSEGEGNNNNKQQMSQTTMTETTDESSFQLHNGGPVPFDNSSVASSSLAAFASRPPGDPHRHSYPGAAGAADSASASARSRNRGSAVPMHPQGLLAQASLRGSNLGNRVPGAAAHGAPGGAPANYAAGSIGGSAGDGMSSVGEPPLPSPTSFADIGVARHDYFVSSSYMAHRVSQLGLRRIEIDRGLSEEPKLLRKGLIVPDEVDKLFAIFYEKINVTVNLLDPILHTPATTFARCPLLFTVVCAVASRYFTERPELYSIAMHFAMTSAASSLMDSKKSVELCQAYLLLSMWPLPSKKHDEDRAWLYLGLAIRMAMDLDLHLPTIVEVSSEQQQREILNRTRTWIICYNMDRSSSAQLGKPMTIRENYIIQDSETWWQRSKFNHPYDLHLCQHTTLMRIMSSFQETYSDMRTPSGIKEDLNLRDTALTFDDKLIAFEKKVVELFEKHDDPNDLGCRYRSHLISFYINYSRLVVLSFGFQYSFSMGLLTPGDDLVMRCLEAAQNVINKLVNDEATRPYLRYVSDGHLVFASFASAFLLKLLRHKFVHLLSEDKRAPIIPLVERLIRVLGDRSVSIDESHTPKIYARFLESLLQKHRVHESTVQRSGQEQAYGGGAHNDPMTKRAGLIIDMEMVREHSGVANGSHPPPSPHPSIQITPPTGAYLPDMYHPDCDPLQGGSDGMEEEELVSIGDIMACESHEFTGSSAIPSGSGTIHPLEEGYQDDDDEVLPVFRQIADPSTFWPHGGVMPWTEMNVSPPTQGESIWESLLQNLDG